ncbi:MAG: hypothetical protein ACXVP0_08985 [Bacteroidia bacterium]
MKQLFLLSLIIPFFSLRSQAISDCQLHYMAGYGISAFNGYTLYYFTNKIGIACFAGPSMGILAGNFKEDIWDKKLGKGVFSQCDRKDTWWGATVGGLTLRVQVSLQEKHHPTRFLYEDLSPVAAASEPAPAPTQ